MKAHREALINKKLRKAAAALVISCYLSGNLTPPQLFASAEIFSAAVLPVQELRLNEIKIPRKIGRVQEVYQGTKSGNAVVVIQDAHAIPEAQKNIRRIISFFEKKYGIRSIALEGAASRLDAQFFKSFPDRKKLKRIFNSYAGDAEVTGGTLAAVLNPYGSHFSGVEDWALYQEGITDYLDALKTEKALLEKLEKENQRLLHEMKEEYSETLWSASQTLRAFERNEKSFLETLKIFSKIERPEKKSPLSVLLSEIEQTQKINDRLQAEVGNLGTALNASLNGKWSADDEKLLKSKKKSFELGEISAAQFFIEIQEMARRYRFHINASRELREAAAVSGKLESLQGEEWFRAFELYARQVIGALVQNETQRRLEEKSRSLALETKLVSLEMTREEWKRYESQAEHFLSPAEIRSQLEFYKNAEKRDEVFLKNIEIKWRSKEFQPQTLLLAGGFHTSGMTQRLREKGISYVVAAPAISEVPKETAYRKQMLGEVSWKKYFKEQKGTVSLYEAFVRGVRDRLLAQDSSASQPSHYLLKNWRDKIILDLSACNRLADAGSYTRFLDELNTQAVARLPEPEIMRKLKKFTKGLLELEAGSRFSQQNILRLFQNLKASTPSLPNSPAVLSPGNDGRVFPHLVKGGRPFQRAEDRSAAETERTEAFKTLADAFNGILQEREQLNPQQIIDNLLQGRSGAQQSLVRLLDENRLDSLLTARYLEALTLKESLFNKRVFWAVWKHLEGNPQRKIQLSENILAKVLEQTSEGEIFWVMPPADSVKISREKPFHVFAAQTVLLPEEMGPIAGLKADEGARTIAIYPDSSLLEKIPAIENNHLLHAAAYVTFYTRSIDGKRTVLISHVQSDLAHMFMADPVSKKWFRDWRWFIRAAVEFYARRHGFEVILSPTSALIRERWEGISEPLSKLVYDTEMEGHGFSPVQLPEPPEWEAQHSSTFWWRKELSNSPDILESYRALFTPHSEMRVFLNASGQKKSPPRSEGRSEDSRRDYEQARKVLEAFESMPALNSDSKDLLRRSLEGITPDDFRDRSKDFAEILFDLSRQGYWAALRHDAYYREKRMESTRRDADALTKNSAVGMDFATYLLEIYYEEAQDYAAALKASTRGIPYFINRTDWVQRQKIQMLSFLSKLGWYEMAQELVDQLVEKKLSLYDYASLLFNYSVLSRGMVFSYPEELISKLSHHFSLVQKGIEDLNLWRSPDINARRLNPDFEQIRSLVIPLKCEQIGILIMKGDEASLRKALSEVDMLIAEKNDPSSFMQEHLLGFYAARALIALKKRPRGILNGILGVVRGPEDAVSDLKRKAEKYLHDYSRLITEGENSREEAFAAWKAHFSGALALAEEDWHRAETYFESASQFRTNGELLVWNTFERALALSALGRMDGALENVKQYFLLTQAYDQKDDSRDFHLSGAIHFMEPAWREKFLDLANDFVLTPQYWPQDPRDPALRGAVRFLIRAGRLNAENALAVISEWIDLRMEEPEKMLSEVPQALHLWIGVYSLAPQKSREQILIWAAGLEQKHPQAARMFLKALHEESEKSSKNGGAFKTAVQLLLSEFSNEAGTSHRYQREVTDNIKNYLWETLIAEDFDVRKVFRKIREVENILQSELGYEHGLVNISIYSVAILAMQDFYRFMSLNETVENAVSLSGGEFLREKRENFRATFLQAFEEEFVSSNKIYAAIKKRSSPSQHLIFNALRIEVLRMLKFGGPLNPIFGEYVEAYQKRQAEKAGESSGQRLVFERTEAPQYFMLYIDSLIMSGHYEKAQEVMKVYQPELKAVVDYLSQPGSADENRGAYLHLLHASLGGMHYRSLFYLMERGSLLEAPLRKLLYLCSEISSSIETNAEKKMAADRAVQLASIAVSSDEKKIFIRKAQEVLDIKENFEEMGPGEDLAKRIEIFLLLAHEYGLQGEKAKQSAALAGAQQALVAWEENVRSKKDRILGLALRGEFLAGAGRLDEAIYLIQSERDSVPEQFKKTTGFYSFILAALHQQAGQMPQAAEALSRYLKANLNLPADEQEDDNSFITETMFWSREKKKGMAEVYAAVLEHPSNHQGDLTESILRSLYYLDMESGSLAAARYLEMILDSPASLPISAERFMKLIGWLVGARYSNWKLSGLLEKATKRKELKDVHKRIKPFKDAVDNAITAGDWLASLQRQFDAFLDDDVIRTADKLKQNKKFASDPDMAKILELSRKSQKRKELTKKIAEAYSAGNYLNTVKLYDEDFGDIPRPVMLEAVRKKAGNLKTAEDFMRKGRWHDALVLLEAVPETDRDKNHAKALEKFASFAEKLKTVEIPLAVQRFHEAGTILQSISQDYKNQWGVFPHPDQGDYKNLQARIAGMTAKAKSSADGLRNAQKYSGIKKAAVELVSQYPEEKDLAFTILIQKAADEFNQARKEEEALKKREDDRNPAKKEALLKKNQEAYYRVFQLGRLIHELAAAAEPSPNALSRANQIISQAMGHYWLPQLTDDFWITHAMAEAEREQEELHAAKGTVSFNFPRGKIEFQKDIRVRGLTHTNGDKSGKPISVNMKEALEIGDTFRITPAAKPGENPKPLKYLFKVSAVNEKDGVVSFDIPKSLEKPQKVIQEILDTLAGGGTMTRMSNNTWSAQRETLRGVIRNIKSTLADGIDLKDQEAPVLNVRTGNFLLDRMMGVSLGQSAEDESMPRQIQEHTDQLRPLIEEYASKEKEAQNALGKDFDFDPEQKEALAAILNPFEPIVMIQGPPGTGKTTVLKAAIRLLMQIREGILVTSQQNHAIDRVILKTIEGAGLQDAWLQKLIRIASNAEGITHEEILRIYGERIRRLEAMDKDSSRMGSAVAGTTVGLTQDRELRKQQRVMRKLKTGIMDESSRATRAETFHLLTYFDSLKRLVSVGDPFQLPAYGITEEDVVFVAQWLGKGPLHDDEMGSRDFGEVFAGFRQDNFKISLFEKSLDLFIDESQGITRDVFAATTPPFFYFDINRRFSGWLLVKHSNYFYRIRKPLRTLKTDPGYFQLDDTQGLFPEGGGNGRHSFGAAPSNERGRIYAHEDENTDRYNLGEADRVIYWINHFINHRKKSPDKMAVITPFRRQVAEIKKTVKNIAKLHAYLKSREAGETLPESRFDKGIMERYFTTRVYLKNIDQFRRQRLSEEEQWEVINAATTQLWVEYSDLIKDKSPAGKEKAKAFREKLGLGEEFVRVNPGGKIESLDVREIPKEGKKGKKSAELEDTVDGMKTVTVDSSIGDEWDAVIVSWVRSNPDHEVGFLADVEGWKRRNVADSRGAEMVQIMDVKNFTENRDRRSGLPSEVSEWGQHKVGIWEEAKPLIGDDSAGLYRSEDRETQSLTVKTEPQNEIQRIAQERRKQIDGAVAYLDQLPSESKINIYVYNQDSNGVYGGAYLLAREITQRLKNVQVRMLVVKGNAPGVFRGVTPKIEVVQQFIPHLSQDVMKDSDFNFVVSGSRVYEMPPLPEDRTVVTGGYFARDFKEHVPKPNGSPNIHMMFSDPHSTVPLVTANRLGVQGKDQMSFEQLSAAKEDWYRRLAGDRRGYWGEDQLSSLESFAKKNGWSLGSSVLTWLYYKDPDFLFAELEKLAAAVETGAFDRQNIWAPGGKQIVIHASVSKSSAVTALMNFVENMGMSYMDFRGEVYEGKLPVTVVFHEIIPSVMLQELQVLSGAMALDETQEERHWIGFPAYATGWGSGDEAASLGTPWLHDRFDAGEKEYDEPFSRLAGNVLKLHEGDKTSPEQWTKMTPSELSEEFFMGSRRKWARYEDLRGWSKLARWFSDSLFQMNMIDDLAIELAKQKGFFQERAENRGADVHEEKISAGAKDKTLAEAALWESKLFDGDKLRSGISDELLEQGRVFFDRLNPWEWRGHENDALRNTFHERLRAILAEQTNRSTVQSEYVALIAHQLKNFLNAMQLLGIRTDKLPGHVHVQAGELYKYLSKRIDTATHVMASAEKLSRDEEAADLTQKTTRLLMDINRLSTGWKFQKFLKELNSISDSVYQKKAQAAAKTLQETASTAAEFSRIWLGIEVPKISEVDLPITFERVMKAHPDLRDASEIKLDLQDVRTFQTYEVYLMEVLMNVLNNAAQSLPPSKEQPRKKGDVSLTARKSGPNEVEIIIADKGAGISAAHIKYIRDLKQFTTKESGHGLGMPRAISLAKGPLQGTFEIESEPGKGTQIKLRFPLAVKVPKKPREVKPKEDVLKVFRAIGQRHIQGQTARKKDLQQDLPEIKADGMTSYLKILEDLEVIEIVRDGPLNAGYPVRLLIDLSADHRELEFVLSQYLTVFDFETIKAQVSKIKEGKKLFAQELPLPGTLDYGTEIEKVSKANSRAKNVYVRLTFEMLDRYFGAQWIKSTKYSSLIKGASQTNMSRIYNDLESIGLLEFKRSEHSHYAPWIRLVKMTRTQRDEILKILLRAETEINLKQAAFEIAEIFRKSKDEDNGAVLWETTKPGRPSLFPHDHPAGNLGRRILTIESLMEAVWALETEGIPPTVAAIKKRLDTFKMSARIRNLSKMTGLDFRALGIQSIPLPLEREPLIRTMQAASQRLRYGNDKFKQIPLLQADLADELHITVQNMMEHVRRHEIDLEAFGIFPDINNSASGEARFSEKRKEWTRNYLGALQVSSSEENVNFAMGVSEAWKKADASVREAVGANLADWKKTRAQRQEEFRNDYIRKAVTDAAADYLALLRQPSAETSQLIALRHRLKAMAPGHHLLEYSAQKTQIEFRKAIKRGEDPFAVSAKGKPEEVQKMMAVLRSFMDGNIKNLDARIHVLRTDGVVTLISSVYGEDGGRSLRIKSQVSDLLWSSLTAPYSWSVSGNNLFIWSADGNPPAALLAKPADSEASGERRGRRPRSRSEFRLVANSIAEYFISGAPETAEALSEKTAHVEASGISVREFADMIEEAGKRLIAEKDQALMRTAFSWMNQVLENDGATAVAFDVDAADKALVEALLSYNKGKGRGQLVAFLAESLGDISSGEVLTHRVRDLDRYRPLYSIRGIRLENADRVARIRLQGKSGQLGIAQKANPNLFYVSAKGTLGSMDPVLQNVLELAADLMVGSVTAREIESTRDLQTSPEEIEDRVLRTLLKRDYEDLLPQGKGILQIHADGSLSVNMPVFSNLLRQIHSRQSFEQAA